MLADGRTYPQWWKPVYIGVEADDGERTRASTSRAGCPYHLHTRRGRSSSSGRTASQGETDGDLRGTGIWTLTPTPTAAPTCASTGACTPTAGC